MKKSIIILAFSSLISFNIHGQIWKDLKQKAEKTVNGGSELSSNEVVNGLKEALSIGSEKAVESASETGGFNDNLLIKIPFPEEALEVKEMALKLGMKNQVEKFELTLNKAAEKASAEAGEILLKAISGMSIQDGFEILNGADTAATHYLRKSTSSQLTDRFKPIVKGAIDEVELTKYWTPLASTYNKNPFKKNEINPDLNTYVTQKALDGLFTLIKQEEASIRENPEARVTELLKKVFGS